MSNISQASFSLFPLMILLIIYYDNRKHQIISTGDRKFDQLIIVVFLAILTFVITRLSAAWPSDNAIVLNRALNCVHVSFVSLIGVVQVKYTLTRVNLYKFKWNDVKAFILHLPFAACVFLAVISAYTGILFYVTETNEYIPGILFWFPSACNALYLFVCILLCIYGWISYPSAEVVSDSKTVLAASTFALAGIVLQLILGDLWQSLPTTTLAVFFVYVSVQSKRITIDSLTGLNNRREFARLLEYRSRHKEPFTVVLLDLDDFKAINDTYGHYAGDEALKRFADILRESFSRMGYFFSRCGGDEFAFILPTHTDEAAQTFIDELGVAVRASNAKSDLEFKLAFSAGYAIRGADEYVDWREMYALADKRMYSVKNSGRSEKRRDVKEVALNDEGH